MIQNAKQIRTILIGGAEGQLGQLAVEFFARQGLAVVASCRTETDLERVRAFAAAAGLSGVHAFACDLADDAQVRRLVETAEARVAPIDGLLNAAGGFRWSPVTELSVEDYDFLFAANVRSSWLLAKHVVPGMRARDFGRLVFVSARASLAPGEPGLGVYTASKAALNAIIGSLAAELKKTDVKVNAVAPTTIDTPANRKAMPDADFTAWVAPAQLLGVVSHLMSPAFEAVQGAVLPVTGRT